MTVGQEDCLDLILVFNKLGKIWNDKIDPEHFIIRESKTGINQDDFLSVTERGHIFTNFTKTTQRDDAYFFLLSFCQKGHLLNFLAKARSSPLTQKRD